MFRAENIQSLVQAKNFVLWHYKTTDKLTTLLEGGYFDEYASTLEAGHIIMVNYDIDNKLRTASIYVEEIKEGKVYVDLTH